MLWGSLLRGSSGHDPSRLFHRSVNKRNVPDYYDVIKEPMALSVLKQKIKTRIYKGFAEFVRDCALASSLAAAEVACCEANPDLDTIIPDSSQCSNIQPP
jgi:hypothetical protein